MNIYNQYIFHSSLGICLAVFLCSSCTSFFADPSDVGDAANCNDEQWIPPYKIKRQELYCAEDLPEETPVSVAELIDYGLRNNPQTKVTWNTARSNAFLLYANYNTFYPHITATEEIDFVKSNFNGGAAGGSRGNIINGITALNNANTCNCNNVATAGGANVIAAGGGGTTAATSTGSVYNQILITDLSVSYIMFDFGGRQASVEAARQALFSANWTHNRAFQTVILTILQSYYNHIAAQANVESQKENLKNAQKNLEAAKTMYEAGVTRLVDYLLARSAFVNAELLLEQAYNNLYTTMGQLATAIGIPADRKFKIVPMPEKLPEVDIENDMHALLEKAKELRPDLAANYANYLNAIEQITIQFSAGMPVVSAFGDYERISFIHNPANNGYIASGGVVVSGPLFDGFLAMNLTKSAKAQAAASYATYKSSEEQAFLDVVTSYYAFKTAIETVKYSKEYLQYAQEAYEVAYYGYREGISNLLDLLTATVTLANARTAYIQSRTQYVTSIASLAYATGTLD